MNWTALIMGPTAAALLPVKKVPYTTVGRKEEEKRRKGYTKTASPIDTGW